MGNWHTLYEFGEGEGVMVRALLTMDRLIQYIYWLKGKGS